MQLDSRKKSISDVYPNDTRAKPSVAPAAVRQRQNTPIMVTSGDHMGSIMVCHANVTVLRPPPSDLRPQSLAQPQHPSRLYAERVATPHAERQRHQEVIVIAGGRGVRDLPGRADLILIPLHLRRQLKERAANGLNTLCNRAELFGTIHRADVHAMGACHGTAGRKRPREEYCYETFNTVMHRDRVVFGICNRVLAWTRRRTRRRTPLPIGEHRISNGRVCISSGTLSFNVRLVGVQRLRLAPSARRRF